jgi:hypothetical protein
VLDWSGVALNETLAIEKPSSRIGEAFLSVQHAIQRMLNPRFLDAYNRALYGPGQLDKRRHFDPVTHEDDRDLMLTWGVRDIVWPMWSPPDRRFSMLAPFPVPLIQWGHRIPESEEQVRPAETRSPLYMPEMEWHPLYVLVCSICTWPQGPRGAAEIYNTKVPGVKAQLEQFPGIVTALASREELVVGTRPPLVVEYEAWGGLADVHRPRDRASDRGFEAFSRTGGVLDQAMGSTRQHDVPEFRKIQEERLREELVELAAILKILKCRRCTAVGFVRYVPQVTLPITLVKSPKAQGDQAKTLAKRLAAARARIGEDPLFKAVLWLPNIPPRQRILDIAKRVAYARVLALRPGTELDLSKWLFTTWVHEQGTKQVSWTKVLERLDFPKDMPMSNRERVLKELESFPTVIRTALSGIRPGRAVDRVLQLIERLPGGSAALLETLHHKVLTKALEDFRADH